MKLYYQIQLLILFLIYIQSTVGIGNRWTKKREREEDESGFDSLIKSKSQDDSVFRNDKVGGEAEMMDSFFKNFQAGADGFDLRKIISESIDTMVDMLSNPEERKNFDKDTIESLLLQLPDDVRNSPEFEEVLKTGLSELEKIDPDEYKKKVDEILDGMLEYAKNIQELLKDPQGLEQIMKDTLTALGISEEELIEAQKILSDPKALQEAMETLAAMEELGLEDTDFEKYASLLNGQEGYDDVLSELMKDPEVLAALNDPENADLLEQMLSDPELLAALGEKDAELLKAARK